MPRHREQRIMPYTPEQIYALVADIERYPEFLPWCLEVAPRVTQGNTVDARMSIGFKAIRESFTTRVTFDPPDRITVNYLDGPFKHLHNVWIFEKHPQGCAIDFEIDFEFRSRLLSAIMGPFFMEAVRIMVRAFEKRAQQLYKPAR